MNCNRIQDLILTDYIDGQMGDGQKSLIDQHLAHCPACEELLTNIRREVIIPINNMPEALPDGVLWSRIKETIEEGQAQQTEKSVIQDLWEKIRNAVHVPRPAFALATFVIMIFMMGSTGQLFINNMPVNLNGQEQMEYISSLINEPVDIAGNNGNDPKSPIEQYFL